MKKRITALVLSAAMVLGMTALAAGAEKTISVTPMTLTINGQQVVPTKSNGEAAEVFAYDGATYVPLRYLSELLGVEVEWDKGAPGTAKLTGVPGMDTYTAEEQGFGGPVQVTLSVTNGVIIDAKVVGDKETQGIGSKAVEMLPKALITAGNPNVDGVSGATMTSGAILRAAKAAYAQATGRTEKTAEVKMKPGTYTASAWGYSLVSQLPVTIEVSENELLAIRTPENFQDHGETQVILQSVIDHLIPRMLEQQSFAVDAVTGATASSNAVKQGVEKALKQALAAGGNDASAVENFRVPSQKTEQGQKEEITVDVLTVGLGNAGIMASMRAVETLQELNGGKPVSYLGIEKAAKIGGQSGMAHAMFAVNPEKYKAEHNNGQDYMDLDDAIEYWLGYTTGKDGSQRAKPDLVSTYLSRSGDMIDWLVYDHGYKISEPTESHMSEGEHDVVFKGEFNLVAFDYSYEDRRLQVWEWQKQLMERIKATGGDYMLETEGYELIYDEAADAVTGVKARNLVTGKEYVIHAKAVIMGTGGFGGGSLTNELYSNENYPLQGDYKQYGMSQNDGKMIKSALDIGAGGWNLGMPGPMIGIASLAGEIHDYPVNLIEGSMNNRTGRTNTWSINDIPEGFISYTNVMYFDQNGNRNAEESIIGAGKNNEPNQYYWYGPYYYVLIDDAQVREVRDSGFPKGTRWRQYTSQGGVPVGEPQPQTYEVMQKALDMGLIFKGDTIEDLAGEIGVDPAALRSSFDRYQGFCEKGVDEDYGKDPAKLRKYEQTGPYYAIKAYPYPYGSCGGLDVDTQLRVLKADHKTVINGLYAVGGDSLGVLMNDEKNYISLGGPANGWVYTSGYLAGESVGRYVYELKK